MAFVAGEIEATLTLDRDPFQRGLREARAEAERFERNKITARASIDTSRARRELAELATLARRGSSAQTQIGVSGAGAARSHLASLAAQLRQFSRMKALAVVGLVGARSAMDQVKALNREVQSFGRQHAIARVAVHGAAEVDRDLRKGAIAAGLVRLGFRGAEEGAGLMGRSFRGATAEVGDLSLSFSKIGPAAGLVAAKFAAILLISQPVVVGLGALVSSAAYAAAGLGALGVAAGGGLVAGMVLAAAATARYKREAQTAGTMANRVARELRGLRGAFARVMAPGVDRVFRGIASALQSIRARIAPLRGAFTQFGTRWAEPSGCSAETSAA